MEQLLRYADLEALGIVNNRATLANWIRDRGFPVGQLIGPNSRSWSETEVKAWIANRPTALKPTPTTKNRRKPERAGAEA
jgi:predicted DNA-binding transcriptional regulator AlpA